MIGTGRIFQMKGANRMKKRLRRFGALAICWAMLTVLVTLLGAASGTQENQPDLSQIDSLYILPENQTLLPAPDGGYFAVTSDGIAKTNVVKLTASEFGWQVQLLQHFFPAYERVLTADENLYLLFSVTDLLEEAGEQTAPAIQVTRFRIKTEEIEGRIIRNTVCDYTRACRAEDGGKLCLVTAPPLEEITDATPISVYRFDSSDYELFASETLPQEGGEAPEPDSSEPSSSDSPPPESDAPDAGPEDSSKPVELNLYLFDRPVTVAELEQFYLEQTGGTVQVTAADGTRKLKGRVVTGDVVDIWIRGKLDSRVIACIPGDLTGRGKPDSSDIQRLYEFLTNGVYLSDAAATAADLNRDGALDTGDLLLLKNLVYQKS